MSIFIVVYPWTIPGAHAQRKSFSDDWKHRLKHTRSDQRASTLKWDREYCQRGGQRIYYSEISEGNWEVSYSVTLFLETRTVRIEYSSWHARASGKPLVNFRDEVLRCAESVRLIGPLQ